MPAQKFASRLPLDDLQNGAFINEGILYATPLHLLLFSFLSFFFSLSLSFSSLTVFCWLTLFLVRFAIPRTISTFCWLFFPLRDLISL